MEVLEYASMGVLEISVKSVVVRQFVNMDVNGPNVRNVGVQAFATMDVGEINVKSVVVLEYASTDESVENVKIVQDLEYVSMGVIVRTPGVNAKIAKPRQLCPWEWVLLMSRGLQRNQGRLRFHQLGSSSTKIKNRDSLPCPLLPSSPPSL